MKNGWVVLLVAVSLFALLGLQVSDSETIELQDIADVFSGQINVPDIGEPVLLGKIIYDRNCTAAGNGLTKCDAGFEAQDFGVINFNYTHDMSKKSCLLSGQKVMMKIKKDNNKEAYIIR